MGVKQNVKRLVTPALKPKLSASGKIIDTYTKYFKTESVVPETFLFESRDGQSMTDSPLAIFEYLLAQDTDKKQTFIWSVVQSEELAIIQRKYVNMSNVHFVVRDSDEYLKWLCQAQYLINNATFQQYVIIKPEQTYINTWHGTPLKTMGYDIPGNPSGAKNVVRNFFMSSFLISPNDHTSQMYLDSYRLRGGYEGQVLEAGYPRIDQTFKTNHDELLKLLFEFKKQIDLSKKIIMYTPTWKGSNISSARNDLEQIHTELASIRSEFGDQYNVLVKVHPFLYKAASTYDKLAPYLIPDCLDTNKVLGIVDVLITDYSSIFFDFLVTDKPILFYCWDDDLYTSDRGKYFEYDELPGPVAFTLEELKTNIRHLEQVTEKSRANYELFKTRFVPYDDGQTTKRYVDYILYGKLPETKPFNIIQSPKKTKLLIYPGGMRNNGITSSLINLIQNIDATVYDVTCFLDQPRSAEQIANIRQLPKTTHLLFRFGASDYTVKEAYQDLRIQARGFKHESQYPNEIYQRECLRLLGNQHYDVAIDFSGYSLYWAKILLASTANTKMCYMHSDMQSDMDRTVNGRKVHKVNLRGLFSLYHRFDYLVSVSDTTRQVNVTNLQKYAAPEKFVYSPNTINPDRILGKVTDESETVIAKTKILPRTGRILIDQDSVLIGYNARPDFCYAKEQRLEIKQQEVDVLGEFTDGEDTYYKISQSNCYLGWVKETDIEVLPDSVLGQEEVSYFGKIATSSRNQLFDGPIGLEETVRLGNAHYLRNVYVTVPNVIATHTMQSVPVRIDGKHYGYLPLSTIRLSKRFNQSSTGKVSVAKKLGRKIITTFNRVNRRKKLARLKEQTIKRINFLDYYHNSLPIDLTGFVSPNPEAEKISLGTMDTVYVHSLNTNSYGNWYLIQRMDKTFVWVPQDQLSLTTINEPTIYSENDTFYYVSLLPSEINVYSTPQNILSNQSQLVKSLDTVKVVRELVVTTAKVYLQVEWHDKLVWVDQEDTEKSLAYGMFNSEGYYIPYPKADEINFVTMGRLSPEKNQVQLVDAFAAYYAEQQTGYLYIIGAGTEMKALKEAVEKHQLEDRIKLVGQIANPFPFMKRCDVFVLTSLYEGQPMVLLEAMTLGMSIISTDIPACRDVLEDGRFGYLTATNDVSGVKQAMTVVAKGDVHFESFNPYAYNQQAIQHFYQFINHESKEELIHE
ncbi:hypothetical protein CBF34_02670 [Vagococcus penaei]|uniref:Uncharacterized protein n=1 Tax=Vagococcus penaei TaxID=633807 RepID=A0A1Q2D3Y7_9ENTE|nr:CDP-glycerol glycerophosphotransferase family protein [Vagococcus penaei]AQP53106.1 hypothetical protein BW732_01920 [Vagococcus penaei]RSU06032.1 hypothetical protein CBF34_02670 [Vagococcus penaei]